MLKVATNFGDAKRLVGVKRAIWAHRAMAVSAYAVYCLEFGRL